LALQEFISRVDRSTFGSILLLLF